MRPTIKILIPVVAVIVIIWLTRWEYRISNSQFPAIYRMNRITGVVEYSVAGPDWTIIKNPEKPKTNAWGDEEVQK